MTLSSVSYQRILVPLDGSVTAEHALSYAADLARQHSAEVLLVYMEYPPSPGSEDDALFGGAGSSQLQAHLDRLRAQLNTASVRAQHQTLVSRTPSETLLKLIRSERVNLIVMSTQGRTNMLRWLFGSNLEKALSSIPVPVMMVRPAVYKIVVPLDGSRWSESAIHRATDIAREHSAELILLHVYKSPVSDYTAQLALAGHGEIADQGYDQMRDQLVSLRNRLRQEGLHAREQMVRSNSPAQAICDFVETEDNVSMIVMSTHGRTGLSRWLVGSVAQKVLKNARCPVTLVYPDAD
jgi:nucleotide-binding universal stress UspA family protein